MSQGDNINFSNSTFTNSIVNIKSRLDNVTQTISSLPDTGDEEKARLEELMKQLSEALQQVPEDKAQDADTVSQMAEQAVKAAKDGNAPMLKVTAGGLVEAAKALAGVVPAALTIATQIAKTLSGT
ncbi:hypothetical protein QUF61_09955 [Candidatus Venteria ishoeyi]|uniref:hypothetical protein n=1 Tax=Candidatus Venteria ishoeyi TaxID=1899563 RepID=UPI0025A5FF9A|nr:hypothetical protein [Candidatus Venteria ishoeyi]MDM8546804.1 hypothetical protein [Candidatus Venteria ishoeyi]